MNLYLINRLEKANHFLHYQVFCSQCQYQSFQGVMTVRLSIMQVKEVAFSFILCKAIMMIYKYCETAPKSKEKGERTS